MEDSQVLLQYPCPRLVLLRDKSPTPLPSLAPIPAPSVAPMTMSPTEAPTARPSTEEPTGALRRIPSQAPNAATKEEDLRLIEHVDIKDRDFLHGLLLGLAGTVVISAVGLLCLRCPVTRARQKGEGEGHPPPPPRITVAVAVSNQDSSGPVSKGIMDGYDRHPHHLLADDSDAFTLANREHLDLANESTSITSLDVTPDEVIIEQSKLDHPERQQPEDGLGDGDSARASTIEVNCSILQEVLSDNSRHQQNQRNDISVAGPSLLQDEIKKNISNTVPSSSSAGLSTEPPGKEIMSTVFKSPGCNTFAGYPNMFDLPPFSPDTPVLTPSEFSAGATGQERQPQIQPFNMPESYQGILINDASFSSHDSETNICNHSFNVKQHSSQHNPDSLMDSDEDSSGGRYDPSTLDGLHDALDKYKNQSLERLRTEVEDTIDGVEGNMSLAVTRALTEPENLSGGLLLEQAENHGSFEASCLCETYDWLKKYNERAGLDSM